MRFTLWERFCIIWMKRKDRFVCDTRFAGIGVDFANGRFDSLEDKQNVLEPMLIHYHEAIPFRVAEIERW